eukprot:CAMPEP_0113680192 /NCGR_PEP_ID=MMETSP0038_2-20120614/11145_1 /TAXON_ID=2898 /ORGANISM="Cryptomonas paramecium" /LENGTH=40 /DNA_ID=CAMNT_0000598471 /DNA_START=727 /DNA_END=849 /DNA_ORIENTATION=+ /assembly_acc=CAM_ASM_000170
MCGVDGPRAGGHGWEAARMGEENDCENACKKHCKNGCEND